MNMAELSKIHLVYGHDAQVKDWVCMQLGMKVEHGYQAIGIAKGTDIIGGVIYNNIYHNIHNRPQMLEMSIASLDKRWASRAIISQLLLYPFVQIGVERVQATVARKNKTARLFLERLGFVYEGMGRKAHHSGSDAAVYSMLKPEWIKGKYA